MTQSNLASVARQTGLVNIMALDMTLVIITAGIDLSIAVHSCHRRTAKHNGP